MANASHFFSAEQETISLIERSGAHRPDRVLLREDLWYWASVIGPKACEVGFPEADRLDGLTYDPAEFVEVLRGLYRFCQVALAAPG